MRGTAGGGYAKRRAPGRARMMARRAPGAVVRSIGVVTERAITPAPRAGERFVAVERLREHVDRAEWSPLRLSGARRARPTSPRLPHALILHLAHAARLASDPAAALDAVAVRPDLHALAALLGADPGAVADALSALCRAGIIDGVGPAGAETDAVHLAAALLAPAPRSAALDWAELAVATAGSPSAWLAAHVLAERLVPGDWTPVPRSALEDALGCGVSGVRSALDRLAATAVVERREQRGGVSAYRFAPPPRPPVAPAQVAPSRVAPSAVPPSSVAPTPATGVRLTVGGVELDVPAGLRVCIEVGPDGRPQISLVPAAPPV